MNKPVPPSGPPPGHPAARIVITVYEDNAMSVEGPMDSRAWVIECLRNAVDAVAAYRTPKFAKVSGKDVDLGKAVPAAITGVKRDDFALGELAGVLRALFAGTELHGVGLAFADAIDPRHAIEPKADYNALLTRAREALDLAAAWHAETPGLVAIPAFAGLKVVR